MLQGNTRTRPAQLEAKVPAITQFKETRQAQFSNFVEPNAQLGTMSGRSPRTDFEVTAWGDPSGFSGAHSVIITVSPVTHRFGGWSMKALSELRENQASRRMQQEK
jgi:hypothetical protein